jgi:hypothetical protein
MFDTLPFTGNILARNKCFLITVGYTKRFIITALSIANVGAFFKEILPLLLEASYAIYYLTKHGQPIFYDSCANKLFKFGVCTEFWVCILIGLKIIFKPPENALIIGFICILPLVTLLTYYYTFNIECIPNRVTLINPNQICNDIAIELNYLQAGNKRCTQVKVSGFVLSHRLYCKQHCPIDNNKDTQDFKLVITQIAYIYKKAIEK